MQDDIPGRKGTLDIRIVECKREIRASDDPALYDLFVEQSGQLVSRGTSAPDNRKRCL